MEGLKDSSLAPFFLIITLPSMEKRPGTTLVIVGHGSTCGHNKDKDEVSEENTHKDKNELHLTRVTRRVVMK